MYGKNNEVQERVITLEEVLQALTGCTALPAIDNGLIVFEHTSDLLSSVNTCAPSITFRRLQSLQDYDVFQETLQNIVVGELGFGTE